MLQRNLMCRIARPNPVVSFFNLREYAMRRTVLFAIAITIFAIANRAYFHHLKGQKPKIELMP